MEIVFKMVERIDMKLAPSSADRSYLYIGGVDGAAIVYQKPSFL